MYKQSDRVRNGGVPCWLLLGILALGLIIALSLGGCGSGGSTTSSGGASSSTTVGGASTTGGVTNPFAEPTPNPLTGVQYVISAANGKIDPTTIAVPVMGHVLFINADDDLTKPSQYHFVADDGSFDTGVLGQGMQFVAYLQKAGTVKFHDALHPDITGSIDVSATLTTNPVIVLAPGLVVAISAKMATPLNAEIAVHESITFVNDESGNKVNHHLVADDGSFDTGELQPTQAVRIRFDQAGTHPFHDQLDPNIKGTITIK